MGEQTESDVTQPSTTVGIFVADRDALSKWCGKNNGMTIRDVISSLTRWFVREPGSVQFALLRQFPAEMSRDYAAMLRRLADAIDPELAPEGADDEVEELNIVTGEITTPPIRETERDAKADRKSKTPPARIARKPGGRG